MEDILAGAAPEFELSTDDQRETRRERERERYFVSRRCRDLPFLSAASGRQKLKEEKKIKGTEKPFIYSKVFKRSPVSCGPRRACCCLFPPIKISHLIIQIFKIN